MFSAIISHAPFIVFSTVSYPFSAFIKGVTISSILPALNAGLRIIPVSFSSPASLALAALVVFLGL